MKKIFTLLIGIAGLALAIAPRVQAQNAADVQEIQKLTDDFQAGKISLPEFQKRITAIWNRKDADAGDEAPPAPPPRQQAQPPQAAQSAAQLVTPAGKAWVIKDNDVQGSGNALVLKNDNTYEYYRRVYGIWISAYLGVRRDSKFNTYSAAGNRLEIRYANDVGGSYSNTHNYTISGTTLTITGDERLSGKWTLTEFSGAEKSGGGGVVLPAGMGWFYNQRQMIFNTNGIYAAYGWPSPWASIRHEGTYTLNPSTGKITINENVPPQPGRDTEYSYSITDFPGGNKTLRIWGQNRNGYQDDVYRLQAYPPGTQLPRTR
jgi:hypothetical protein